MTQYDILELLKKAKGRWLTVKQIAKKLDRKTHSISHTLQRVKTFKGVRYKVKYVEGYNIGLYSYKE